MEIVHGDDVWQQHRRHWHLYADETRVGAEISYDRAPDSVAMTPAQVLAWMAAQVDRVRPQIIPDQHASAQRLTDDARLREVHLKALSWGKSTGAFIRLSPGTVMRLYAHSVGPSHSETSLPSLLPAVCDQQHA